MNELSILLLNSGQVTGNIVTWENTLTWGKQTHYNRPTEQRGWLTKYESNLLLTYK